MPFRLAHMKPILNSTKIQTSRTGIPDPKVKAGAIIHAAVWGPHFADLRITQIKRAQYVTDLKQGETIYKLFRKRKPWKPC